MKFDVAVPDGDAWEVTQKLPNKLGPLVVQSLWMNWLQHSNNAGELIPEQTGNLVET
jgi:hypothetical protein